jgi:sporulation protein YlmC with PRC-barrel domain
MNLSMPKGVNVEFGAGELLSVDPQRISSGALIGSKVMDSNRQEVGKVEEIVLDLSRGLISYIVMSTGGFAGIGDKFIALPLEELKFKVKDRAFYLSLEKKTVKKARGFDKTSWPRRASWPPNGRNR